MGSLGEGNILARFRINSGGPIGQPLFVGAFSIKAYYYFVNLFLVLVADFKAGNMFNSTARGVNYLKPYGNLIG